MGSAMMLISTHLPPPVMTRASRPWHWSPTCCAGPGFRGGASAGQPLEWANCGSATNAVWQAEAFRGGKVRARRTAVGKSP